MPETLTTQGVLVIQTCPECHVVHAIPAEMRDRMKTLGGSAYCPNGHSWHFAETDNAKLKRQLKEAERTRDAARTARDAALDQADAAERSARAYRGHATRLRNRAAAGVCLAGCHRHFENLARHMASKHPEFAETADA